MDFRVIALLIAVIIFAVLYFVVRLKGPRNTSTGVYSFHILSVLLWALGLAMFYQSENLKVALFWTNVLYIAGSLIAASFLHFSFVFPPGKTSLSSLKQFLIYIPNIILFYLFFFTPIVVKEVVFINGVKGFIYGRGHILWDLQFDIVFIWAFLRFIKMYKRSIGIIKMRLRYILLGTLLALIWAGTTNVIMPWFGGFKLMWSAPVFSLTWSAFIVYAIIKYRLMDIKVALTRAGIFTIVYLFILGIPFWIGFRFLGKGLWILPISIMAVFATLGPFIFMYLRQRAEDVVLKDQHRYQEILRKLSATLTLVKDLNRLLKLVVLRVARAVKVNFACIYLADYNQNKFIQKYPYTTVGFFPDFPHQIPYNSELIFYIRAKGKPVFAEELTEAVKREFNLRTGLIIPSFVRQRLLGFLVLGPKSQGAIYTQEDAAIFGILANQLALAIENTEFISESQKTQAQLFAARHMASLGTMAGGMTHQINNRFHAIIMASSDLIDTLKLFDWKLASKDEIKELSEQIRYNLERVNENAKHGGKIVNDFWSLSQLDKIQKEARVFELREPLERGIEMVRIKTAFAPEVIERDIQDGSLSIKGDFALMQDVYFNLIDNAKDALDKKDKAIQNKELSLPESAAYKPRIIIRMFKESSYIVTKLQDNGIGMSQEALKRLFVPFFTSKATSIKGAGRGLFVIQRIIEAHQGTIEVESEYGRGMTFTIKLPIAKEKDK